ncbi:MAG: cutinase family protein [Mycolicibacterium sp.]|uniref:Cutinase n=1 Tax=Mycolicibacterium insubricum TaxID=444597 RepID=A0A1X0D1P3_9MYCO|nr:cutinase family protein [Mycolicibacterium insubricum]MCB9441006.1 cutinase family protein [Mycolicibacterium sp.]MCV7080968.1 cutinase family protein [Mycolicibacterium insubricum]ORA66344.1 cutinase family protein [Mycolicibacterium insubricum]
MGRVRVPRWSAIIGAALFTFSTIVAPQQLRLTLDAEAVACPHAELVFARGRMEAPGPGEIGATLYNLLRVKARKDISLYAVNYPANTEVDIGANDMSRHILGMIARCPSTRIVVGGYSLGAAVSDVVLAVPLPFVTFRNPLPASAAPNIAAVALFGNGFQWVGPITSFSPVYRDRTIELCHGDDPICNPTIPQNWRTRWPDHLAPAYIKAGMVNQAANFIAARI